MSRIFGLVVILVLSCVARDASAVLVKLSFTGEVDEGAGTIPTGTPFDGFAIYDDSQANTGDPDFQSYTFTSGELNFPGESHTFGPSSLSIDNDGAFGDRTLFNAGPAIVMGGVSFNAGGRLIELIDTSGAQRTSADLPVSANIGDYNFSRFLFFSSGGDFRGQITSLNASAVAIPEPSPVLFMSIAIIAANYTVARRKLYA